MNVKSPVFTPRCLMNKGIALSASRHAPFSLSEPSCTKKQRWILRTRQTFYDEHGLEGSNRTVPQVFL